MASLGRIENPTLLKTSVHCSLKIFKGTSEYPLLSITKILGLHKYQKISHFFKSKIRIYKDRLFLYNLPLPFNRKFVKF